MPQPEVFLKQDVGEGEIEIYRVLGSPAIQTYNDSFDHLVLPHALDYDSDVRTLTLPYYEGTTFNHSWDIEDGGAHTDIELARAMPLLIKELSQVDVGLFTSDPVLARLPNLAFDHSWAVDYFGKICSQFADDGILSPSQQTRAEELLAYPQTSETIVSNGDFYPKNLIRQPDARYVLIDWEVWNDNSPFFIVDHPENVAATQYVHMWGNPRWQAAYRKELDEQFSFDPESFDKGVLMKTFTLASFFRKHRTLFNGQISILQQIL